MKSYPYFHYKKQLLHFSVCEEVAHEGSIFDDGELMMDEIHNFEEAKTFVSDIQAGGKVEERVRTWTKKLKDFILESKQIRRENDCSGPQQELEYWKRRGAQFSQLVKRLQVFQNFLISRSVHVLKLISIQNFF